MGTIEQNLSPLERAGLVKEILTETLAGRWPEEQALERAWGGTAQTNFILEQSGVSLAFGRGDIAISLGAAMPGVYIHITAETEQGVQEVPLSIGPNGAPNFDIHPAK